MEYEIRLAHEEPPFLVTQDVLDDMDERILKLFRKRNKLFGMELVAKDSYDVLHEARVEADKAWDDLKKARVRFALKPTPTTE